MTGKIVREREHDQQRAIHMRMRDVLSTTEENAHDEGMGESDLDAIYQPIPCSFEDG